MKLRKRFIEWRRHRNMCKEIAIAVERGDLIVSGFVINGMEMIDMHNVHVYNSTFDSNKKRPHMILTKKAPQKAAVVVK